MELLPLVVRDLIAAEHQCTVAFLYRQLDQSSGVAASPVVLSLADLAACDSAGGSTESRPEKDWKIVYDVMRVRHGSILFKKLYAQRFAESMRLTFQGNRLLSSPLEEIIEARLQQYLGTDGVFPASVTEQNLKIVSWLPPPTAPTPGTSTSTNTAAAASPLLGGDIPMLLFLARSAYPSEESYVSGVKMGLLFNARRVNPNAKVAQSELRTRANYCITQNGLFEVLLVHSTADRCLVPEGSRSNFLLQKGDGSFWCSEEVDILVGVTLKTTYRVVEACGLGQVHHSKLTLLDLVECRSLFMLGTSPTIMPVQSLLLYHDAETQQRFDEAARTCGIDFSFIKDRVTISSDGSSATLHLAVDPELARRLRMQYFQEAANS